MKNTLILFICLSLCISCKKENKSEDLQQIIITDKNATITQLKGEFVYFADAAVLQTKNKIYGVFLTDKMQELNKLAQKYKKTPTDMVTVEIKGKVTNQKDDKILWENKVEILEILNVTQSSLKENNAVKIGKE